MQMGKEGEGERKSNSDADRCFDELDLEDGKPLQDWLCNPAVVGTGHCRSCWCCSLGIRRGRNRWSQQAEKGRRGRGLTSKQMERSAIEIDSEGTR